MKNISLGRYIPLDSVIHKMDPRAKIISMLLLLVCIFIDTGFIGYAIVGAVIVLAVLLAKLKIDFIWRAMKPMLFMLVFLLVINILVIKTGYVMLTIGNFRIYSDAVVQTCYITIRLILMINITTLLTATTKPMDMTIAIEDLLTPFKSIGVPAHDIAMMISIALRFIPTLLEEADRIMKAQASRGVDLEEGSFKEKINAILSLIVPLFVSSFQKAEDLANAMEARGYNPGAKRVRYKQLKFAFRDYTLFVVSVGLLAGLIVLKVTVL
mgnify:CR=1 FL=1